MRMPLSLSLFLASDNKLEFTGSEWNEKQAIKRVVLLVKKKPRQKLDRNEAFKIVHICGKSSLIKLLVSATHRLGVHCQNKHKIRFNYAK